MAILTPARRSVTTFEDEGITYVQSEQNKTELYEAFEPHLNAGEVELLDLPKLQEQLLTLVRAGHADRSPAGRS